MNRQYDDLLALTDRKPSFFQAGGVPRWEDFQPGRSTGVYARDCAIAEIACQGCDTRFHVLMESRSGDKATVLESIRSQTLHYGDPPNVGCCHTGPSMNSEMLRVLEYWSREYAFEWKRDPSAEIAFRRFGDPWTPEMRERAAAIIADPETTEDLRASMQDSLAAEDARVEQPAEEPPEYASEFRTAA